MKSAWIAIGLMLLVLATVAVNAQYVEKIMGEMDGMLDALPEITDGSCAPACREIADYWQAHVNAVGLSVGYTVIDRVSEQAEVLAACAECGDAYGFESAKALLRDAVRDTHRLEHFSVGNLL